MCELFGFSGRKERQLNNELKEFFSHAPDNPHGWGMALFGSNIPEIKKEEIRADRSEYLTKRLSVPVFAETAIAHIRFATIGVDDYENSHPFTGVDVSGRNWTLAHNGTIFEGDALAPYIHKQKGTTDSERILLYIIDLMNRETEKKHSPLDINERFKIIDSVVTENSRNNKLNLLIYDGEVLYAHTNFKGSLNISQREEGICFSTKPLSEGEWESLPFTTLTAYKKGKRILGGTNHGNEYIPDEKSIQALYLAYSVL